MSQRNKPSALSPFKHRTFAIMWLAALISNIGTWMHSVGASWLMTDLSPSPLLISLVQSAAMLPMFLFALPAGALADIFNRRTLLLLTNGFMFVAAILFAILVWRGEATALWLLLLTFCLGAGTAFMAPAWQAVIPRMVPREDLPQAIALGGISMNLSRAVGPAVAGILISLYGLASPFVLNAASFIFIILALVWWKYQSPTPSRTLPPERVFPAIRAGTRYAWHSQPMKNTLWHVLGFMFFANAFWGLLPLISRSQLAGGASFFGFMMAAIGIGGVLGAFLLPTFKARLSANQLVALGGVGAALVIALLAFTRNQALALGASFVFGLSWILVLSTLNISAQVALPDWVRARGLAVYLMTFSGSMSLGAAFWGWLADAASIRAAMLGAAAGALIFIAFARRFELQQGENLDFSPSHYWPEPVTYQEINHDAGPVLVQVRYRIDPTNRTAFLEALYALRASRKRNGAYRWGIYEDTRQPGAYVEYYLEETWAEHLRHHDRLPHADTPLQEAVLTFLTNGKPPQVRSYLAAHRPDRRRG
ncbi:MAG: MFS transporter [Thiothrix sp.]|nr:MFS transporter [Thiothrix sp.]HPE59459.1 MFS transporter [Thiolinea sp.]